MKITLHSIQDLHDLMALFTPVTRADQGREELNELYSEARLRGTGNRPKALAEGEDEHMTEDEVRAWMSERYPNPIQTMSPAEEVACQTKASIDVAPSKAHSPNLEQPAEPKVIEAADGPDVDSRGIPWNAQVHSSSRALNKSDGTWRAARGVDKDLLSSVEAELLAAVPKQEAPAELPVSDAPVITETHPLPADEPPAANTGTDAITPGLEGLAERAEAAAGDAPDGVIAVLDAGKKFIEAHGVATYNAVKGAVVGDTPTQKLQPAERRRLCAALSLYDPTSP